MKDVSISILKHKIKYGWRNDPDSPSDEVTFILTIDGNIFKCKKKRLYNPAMNELEVEEELKNYFK